MSKGIKLIVYLALSSCFLILFSAVSSFEGYCADKYEVEEESITGYYYDPATGEILPKYGDLSPGEVDNYLKIRKYRRKTVGDRVDIYDTGNNLVGRVYTIKDSEGNTTGLREDYYGYYNGVRKLTERIDKGLDEVVKNVYTYGYDDSGLKRSDGRIQYDDSGQLLREYSIDYDQLGRRIYYMDERYKDGSLDKSYEYTNYDYHSNGELKEYSRNDKNASGQTTAMYTFGYNDQKTRTFYNRLDFNPDTGKETRGYTANYNDDGKETGVTDRRYDSNGDIDKTYAYSNYSYYDNGVRETYTRTTTDSSSKTTQVYNESLNDSGVRTSYDWINYDPATDNKVR
ncbi:MAG: hypothetical protein ABH872_05635, partial [Candidatus Omnitrophota bacterium]